MEYYYNVYIECQQSKFALPPKNKRIYGPDISVIGYSVLNFMLQLTC